jgi:predicted unusual protein kinase regulating ubiquinone biosynthesis (AarF/ABC1/UbiB family)
MRRKIMSLKVVVATLAGAGATAAVALARRRGARRGEPAAGGQGSASGSWRGSWSSGATVRSAPASPPGAVRAAGRLDRNLAVAGLGARIGAATAANKAQRVFASAERRQELDERLQLQTAEQVAAALGSMKGALMKLGQLASFLDDGMPEPVRQALSTLQADAPPMAPELAAAVIRQELGDDPDKVFAEWDPVPIAAASIGQVHRAIAHDGRALAVKVQYPGVAEAVGADLANLDLAAMGLGFLFPNVDGQSLGAELRSRLTEELDYEREAANQREFASWYRHHPFISVPEVVDELSTARVLTSELAEGVRFDEMETWEQGERDLAAEAIYRFVFRSLYRFGVFNGDPHPGNYLFRPGGQVTFLDFGLVKRLEPEDIALAFALVSASIIHDDPSLLRKAVEDAGLFVRGAPLSDERVAEYMSYFWDPIRTDGVTTITAEWASAVTRRYLDREGFADVIAHASMPASFLILQRINLGLLAILGRLDATANWHRVARELWPTDDAPSTPLGEAEAEWWAAMRPQAIELPL